MATNEMLMGLLKTPSQVRNEADEQRRKLSLANAQQMIAGGGTTALPSIISRYGAQASQRATEAGAGLLRGITGGIGQAVGGDLGSRIQDMGVPPEERTARMRQELLRNMGSDPESMRATADQLASQGLTGAALQLRDMADKKESADITRSLAGKKIVNKTITRTEKVLDPLSGEMKEVVVKIPIPHEYDMKTKKLTPIFSEDEINQAAQDEARIVVEHVPSESPAEKRVTENLSLDLLNLPVGSALKLPSGRYVRRISESEFSKPLTLEEINKQSGIDEQARVEDLGA